MRGQNVSLVVGKFCYNDEIAAIPVTLKGSGIDSSNDKPHLTWAMAEGVAPFKSNEMLTGDYSTIKFQPTEIELTVEFLEWEDQD